jgi:hypothetical protein
VLPAGSTPRSCGVGARRGVKAVGLTGADASRARDARAAAADDGRHDGGSRPRRRAGAGRAGGLLTDLLALGYVPVVASIGVDRDGALLNVNADVSPRTSRRRSARRADHRRQDAGVFDAAGQHVRRSTSGRARDGRGRHRARRHGGEARCVPRRDAGGVDEVRIVDGGRANTSRAGTLLHSRRATDA